LEICFSLSEAEYAEIKWISHFKSNQKEFGYNLTSGGNVSQSSTDPRVKEKISKTMIEKWKNSEYKNNFKSKIKDWHKNNDNPFLDKHHSEESKLKIGLKSKNWHKNNDNPFLGKKHSNESRKKMSEAAKKRCKDPNWVCPLLRKPISDETRNRMSKSGKKRFNKKEYKEKLNDIKVKLFEAAKICKTQIEISKKIGCTPSNISYLIKRLDIKDEIKNLLKENSKKIDI